MRHRKLGRQFSRNTSHRKAMFRALTANLMLHERIQTTDAKAKELRRIAERLISRARRLGPVAYTPWDQLDAADQARRLAAKREIGRFLQRFGVSSDEAGQTRVDLVEKVFVDLAKRYEQRPGGYTRIIRIGNRRGDNAPMCLIELLDSPASEVSEDGGESTTPTEASAEAGPTGAPAEG